MGEERLNVYDVAKTNEMRTKEEKAEIVTALHKNVEKVNSSEEENKKLKKIKKKKETSFAMKTHNTQCESCCR